LAIISRYRFHQNNNVARRSHVTQGRISLGGGQAVEPKIAFEATYLGQTKETTMTTISEYQSTRSISSPTPSLPADFVIVGLWSLLGLSFSAVLATAGFAADIGAVLAIAG
jgi:hypothetical protein